MRKSLDKWNFGGRDTAKLAARARSPQWQVIIQDLFLKIWDAVVNKVTAAYQRHAAYDGIRARN